MQQSLITKMLRISPKAIGTCTTRMPIVVVILFFVPDEDNIDKVKARHKTLIAPCYVLRMKTSRGKKHGEQPWQVDPWRAKDASRGAKKHHCSSILDR